MFQFPRFAPRPYVFRTGCPDKSGRVPPFGHRRVTGCLPPRRRFSQAAAPFIASCRLGIHRMRLFTWPYNPNRPGRGARASSTSLRLFSLSAFSAHATPPPPVQTGRQAAAHARTSRTVKEKTGRRAGRRRLPATRKRTRSALAARRNPNRRTPPRQTPAAGAPRPVVEPGRIELPTSCVQGRRSPG